MSNFILVETPEPEPIAYPFIRRENKSNYPRNWSRASWLVRKMSGFRCVWCGSAQDVRTHHMGVPYANGVPGNRHDKHDLRIENLYALCETCEARAERLFPGRPLKKSAEARKRDRWLQRQRCLQRQHQRLKIGTGLVLWLPENG